MKETVKIVHININKNNKKESFNDLWNFIQIEGVHILILTESPNIQYNPIYKSFVDRQYNFKFKTLHNKDNGNKITFMQNH